VVPHAGEGVVDEEDCLGAWLLAISTSNLQYLTAGGHHLVTCEKLQ
jgi:hypothetical protein